MNQPKQSFFFCEIAAIPPSQWKGLSYGLHIMSAQPVVSHAGCCFVPPCSQKWQQNTAERRGGKDEKGRRDENQTPRPTTRHLPDRQCETQCETHVSQVNFATQRQEFFIIFIFQARYLSPNLVKTKNELY